jgi:hypothetical protein
VLATPAKFEGALYRQGRAGEDVDLFRIEAKAGERWVIETRAAQDKSPADTKIDVLHADGSPVERLLLRAIRDDFIAFRPINSLQENNVRTNNWQEMRPDQFLYMGGEVCKIRKMPEGPDAGFTVYANKGKRRGYFDSTATIHAKDDPVYAVEAYPSGTTLVDNGLPTFPVYFSNDDDAERELGSDSRLMFTAPADGAYLVRVTDVRGFGGPEYKYALTVRRPQPDFAIGVDGKSATVGAGSGQRISFLLDRRDGFDGEVRVDVAGLPKGYHISTPVVVEADHLQASAVLYVDADVAAVAASAVAKSDDEPIEAPRPPFDWSKVTVTASATVNGRKVEKTIGDLGRIKAAAKPKYVVELLPDPDSASAGKEASLVVAPGASINALVRIERNGFDGELRFDVDNLPHGVIVDNIGLNGIMIREKELERRIVITAAEWAQETTRLVHATARAEGKEASPPIALTVRKPSQLADVAPPRAAAGQ